MSAVLTTLVILVFLALAGGVAYLWLRLHDTSRREALQALAARRGWALTMSEEKLGRPGVLRIMPRGGPTWTVETRRGGLEGEPRTRPVDMTEFVTDDPRWADGLLILGPGLPPQTQIAAGTLDTEEGRRLVEATLGAGLVNYAPFLQLWPSPPGISVFATAAPVPRFDLSDLARHAAAWSPADGKPPVAIFGGDGLRLRAQRGIRRADQMERFIDHALELARIL